MDNIASIKKLEYKAGEKALLRYPFMDKQINSSWFDTNEKYRVGFKEGYEQAIFDLWHDPKQETPDDGEKILLHMNNDSVINIVYNKGVDEICIHDCWIKISSQKGWCYLKDILL